MKRIHSKRFTIIIIIVVLILFILGLVANYKVGPFVTNIEISESKRFDDKVIFNIEVGNYFFKLNKATWCLLKEEDEIPLANDSDWIKSDRGYCSFTVNTGDYHVFLKDAYGNVIDVRKQKVHINKILDIKMNKSTVYMWKGRKEQVTYEIIKLGQVKEDITFQSENNAIATVSEDGTITGVNYGTTMVKAVGSDGTVGKVQVIVTPFINKPEIKTNKSYIKCKQFNSHDADMIDQILFDRVDSAGYGTRGGVVAATRFLSLEFAYRIHYFAENGRLNNYAPYKHVDGEGRYYHRGLYLNENKFTEIKTSFVGPVIWGCDLQTFTQLPEFTYKNYYPNGLDCSGFVTWALYNGGFDVGDIGAGENAEHQDLDDLGKKVMITEELMQSGKVKVGDLIGLNGHMAILAGWDDANYYIAESLNNTGGVVITTVAKNQLVHNSIYKYIILMDDVYKKDGIYTNMW